MLNLQIKQLDLSRLYIPKSSFRKKIKRAHSRFASRIYLKSFLYSFIIYNNNVLTKIITSIFKRGFKHKILNVMFNSIYSLKQHLMLIRYKAWVFIKKYRSRWSIIYSRLLKRRSRALLVTTLLLKFKYDTQLLRQLGDRCDKEARARIYQEYKIKKAAKISASKFSNKSTIKNGRVPVLFKSSLPTLKKRGKLFFKRMLGHKYNSKQLYYYKTHYSNAVRRYVYLVLKSSYTYFLYLYKSFNNFKITSVLRRDLSFNYYLNWFLLSTQGLNYSFITIFMCNNFFTVLNKLDYKKEPLSLIKFISIYNTLCNKATIYVAIFIYIILIYIKTSITQLSIVHYLFFVCIELSNKSGVSSYLEMIAFHKFYLKYILNIDYLFLYKVSLTFNYIYNYDILYNSLKVLFNIGLNFSKIPFCSFLLKKPLIKIFFNANSIRPINDLLSVYSGALFLSLLAKGLLKKRLKRRSVYTLTNRQQFYKYKGSLLYTILCYNNRIATLGLDVSTKISNLGVSYKNKLFYYNFNNFLVFYYKKHALGKKAISRELTTNQLFYKLKKSSKAYSKRLGISKEPGVSKKQSIFHHYNSAKYLAREFLSNSFLDKPAKVKFIRQKMVNFYSRTGILYLFSERYWNKVSGWFLTRYVSEYIKTPKKAPWVDFSEMYRKGAKRFFLFIKIYNDVNIIGLLTDILRIVRINKNILKSKAITKRFTYYSVESVFFNQFIRYYTAYKFFISFFIRCIFKGDFKVNKLSSKIFTVFLHIINNVNSKFYKDFDEYASKIYRFKYTLYNKYRWGYNNIKK